MLARQDRKQLSVLVGVLILLSGSYAGAATPLAWRSGPESLQATTPDEITATLATALAARGGGTQHVVLQFAEPVRPELRAELAAQGVTLLDYLGEHAFFAAIEPGTDAAAISRTPELVAADAILPQWKLHPILAAGETPTWAVVGSTREGAPTIGVYVQFHGDVDLNNGAALALGAGANVRDALQTVNGLVVELPQTAVMALATEDAVEWIEPALPKMSETNNSNRALTQAGLVQAAPYNLTGAGINVLVYDGGKARSTHVDFQGRLTVGAGDNSAVANHATHVAGTIGGAGVANATYKGMAPGVTLQSYGLENTSGGIFLYTNPGDIEADYGAAIANGAVIANNSIGTNTESNGFSCSIQGDYGLTDQVIDAIVRGDGLDVRFVAPFRVIWAAGNERQGSRCDVEGYGDYYSTAPPSGAKNHIAVAAVNSNNDTMTSFSSWGPVDDGRLKPDISAPGCQSDGDLGVTSCVATSDTAYDDMCGTSMATPTTTGCLALLLQDFKVQFPGEALPRNSTLKALLAHTAVDLGNTGPDYQFGYGSIRIKNAIDLMRLGKFDEHRVGQGGTYTRQVVVAGGTSELKVTLAWDDVPGTPLVNPALVNDLDLVVLGPTGTRFYPWTLAPTNPSAAAVRTQADHVNNIEQVLVNNPQAGTWTIQVQGYNVPQGPQPFSIVGDGVVYSNLNVTFPSGRPTLLAPGAVTNFDVNISGVGESLVGTPQLLYRYSGGAFTAVNLTALGGELWRATLPAAACGNTPEFYFSLQGSLSGAVTEPAAAPAVVYAAGVGTLTAVFTDDFQTNKGWVATVQGATAGGWERGVPVNDPSWQYDPESDSDGSGMCYLTGNFVGNSDVDNGAVVLTSPAINLSGGGEITVRYDYYLYLTYGHEGVDKLLVQLSNNGDAGPWLTLATHTTHGGLSWRGHSISHAELVAAGATFTANTKLRFTANDANTQSIVEAGLDAVLIERVTCSGPSDTTPPTPNPMTFAAAPAPASTTAITMTATTATDADSPPVQYFFVFVSGGAGGADSAWQAGTGYTDTGLAANTAYTYAVKARDSAATPNETGLSGNAATATLIQTPTGVTFGAVTANSIVLNASGTFTNLTVGSSGLYFDSTTTGGDGGLNAWVQTTTDTATGLSPNTEYTFRVKARNQGAVETAYGPTATMVTRADVPPAPTLGNAGPTGLTVDVNAGLNPAATEFAIQCNATADPAWNGRFVSAAGTPSVAAVWRTEPAWSVVTLNGLLPNTLYTFAVKARNADGLETALGSAASLSTLPTPTGACCAANGTCTIATANDCVDGGGAYLGDGTGCTPNNCAQPTGACCFADGSCVVETSADCAAAGGAYQGDGTACVPNNCPQPTGACCVGPICTLQSAVDCLAAGGAFEGVDTGCAPNPCIVDCNGNEIDDGVDLANCAGSPWCDDCNSNGVLDVCDISGGVSQDGNANGVPDECEAPPVCRGDANCDGTITWRDIDFFVSGLNDNLAAWQALFPAPGPSCPFANLDCNADGAVTWRDIDPFIGLLNTNCP